MPQSSRGFVVRMSVFYAASFLFVGVLMPFFPLWLSAKGLDAAAIGLILSVPAFVRIGAVPFFTRFADRRNALREVLIAATSVAAIGYAALGFTNGVVAILVVLIIASFAYSPIVALGDAFALRGLKVHRASYGAIRLWGSVAFIAANLGAGFLLDIIRPEYLIWVIAGVAALTAMAAFRLVAPPLAPSHESGAKPPPLWRNPAFLAVILAASLIQASHAFYYGFSTISWSRAGFDGLSIGLLWALGVVAEIVLFALSRRLPPWFAPEFLLLIGAGGGVIRWLVMAGDPPGWSLPFLQCLHAASFGCTHLGLIGYVARHAPERYAATAQGYFAIANGLLLGLATLLAGLLYARHGAAGYAGMALIALAGGLALITARAVWPQAFRSGEMIY